MEAVVINIFGETPDTISTHFGFGAIWVKDAHPEVGHFRGFDQDQAICSDAKMTITPFLGIVGKVLFGEPYFKVVDQDEIVTQAVHFNKGNHQVLEYLLRNQEPGCFLKILRKNIVP